MNNLASHSAAVERGGTDTSSHSCRSDASMPSTPVSECEVRQRCHLGLLELHNPFASRRLRNDRRTRRLGSCWRRARESTSTACTSWLCPGEGRGVRERQEESGRTRRKVLSTDEKSVFDQQNSRMRFQLSAPRLVASRSRVVRSSQSVMLWWGKVGGEQASGGNDSMSESCCLEGHHKVLE